MPGLYGWRKTHSYAAEEPVVYPPGSIEAAKADEARRLNEAIKRQERRDRQNQEDPFGFEEDFAEYNRSQGNQDPWGPQDGGESPF